MAIRKDSETQTQRSAVLSQSVSELTCKLQLGPAEIGKVIGMSACTASRLLNGEYLLTERTTEWEASVNFVRICQSLLTLVGDDYVLARDWLRTPNKGLRDATPVTLLASEDGLLCVADYLDAHRLPGCVDPSAQCSGQDGASS